jgi:hypothetical protein
MFQGSIGTNTASLSTVKVTFDHMGQFISSPYNTNAIWVSSGNVWAPGTGNVGIGVTTKAAVTEKLTVTGNISANGSLSATGTGPTYVNGDVGIRTNRPYADLDVVDSTNQTVIRAVNTHTSGSTFIGAGQTTTSQDLPFYIRRINSSHPIASAGNVEIYNNGSMHFRTLSRTLDKVVIDTAGNVGIGTDSPSATLHVKSTDADGIKLTRSTVDIGLIDFSNNDYNITSSTNHLRFSVPSSKFFTFATGNVGIGTDTPTAPLHVIYEGGAGVGFKLDCSATGNRAKLLVADNDTNAYFIAEDGYISIGGCDDLAADNLNINEDTGAVGIGTISPNANAMLDVTSTTKAFMPPRMNGTQRDAVPLPAAGMVVYNTTANVLNCYNGSAWSSLGGVRDVDGDTYILAETSSGNDDDTLHFWVGAGDPVVATEKLQMTLAGLIPVIDSDMTLGATGKYWSTAYIDDVEISNDLNVADEATVTNAVNAGQINVGTATGATVGQIRASGDIYAFYTSDIKFKKNIAPISDSLYKLNQIRGVEFDWTDLYVNMNGGLDDTFIKRHDVGVIAQEVEAVLPEVVATRDDGTKAVRYEKIVPLLIESIKELTERVQDLESQIK